jgi:hypothetical protein
MDFLGYIYPIQELDTRKELLFSVVFLRLFIPEDIAVYAYKCHLSSSFSLTRLFDFLERTPNKACLTRC